MVFLKMWKFSEDMQNEFPHEPISVLVGPCKFIQVTYTTLRLEREENHKDTSDPHFAENLSGVWVTNNDGFHWSDFSVFNDGEYEAKEPYIAFEETLVNAKDFV